MASNYNCQICPCCPDFTGVTVNPTSVTFLPGSTSQMTATETQTDCNGTNFFSDITSQATWSSSNTSVVTVGSPNPAGLVTAVSPGSATMTATFTDVVFPLAPSGFCSPKQMATKSGNATCDVTPTVQITGGNNFVFTGSDSTLIQFNVQQAQGNPSGGAYSWSASNNRVSFDNSSAAIVHLTGISPSTGLLDTTLTVIYSLNQQSASPASRAITVRIFKFLQQSGQIQVIQLNGPDVFGYDANVFYNVFTNPGGQIVPPGYSGVPVLETVTITSGNFPVSLTQGTGATNQNSQILDQLSLRSNMPLDPSLQIKASQDLGVGGFFVRNNTLLYQASGPSITSNGPFN